MRIAGLALPGRPKILDSAFCSHRVFWPVFCTESLSYHLLMGLKLVKLGLAFFRVGGPFPPLGKGRRSGAQGASRSRLSRNPFPAPPYPCPFQHFDGE